MEAPSVESMLAEVEAREAAEQAEVLRTKLESLKAQVKALTDAGVDVSISLHGSTDNEKDSIEIGPADCRCKVYLNITDVPTTSYKLQRVKEIQEEARRLEITAPPKMPKMKGGEQ